MSNSVSSNTSNGSDPLLPLVKGDFRDQFGSFFSDAWIWVASHWLHILIAVGVAVALVLGLRVIRHWAMKACQRGSGVATWPAIIGRAIARTGNFFMIMLAAKLVVGYAHAPAVIGTTVTFLFTIASVFQAAIWVREFIFGLVESRTIGESASESLVSALGIIRLLVSIVVFAIALVVVLGNLGVNVTGLIAGLGIGGIGIGLAAQGIFADLFAALAILFDRPFHVGDTIKYGDSTGTVVRIGLKNTRVRSATGEMRIISNKNLLDKELQNLSDRTAIRFTWIISVFPHNDPAALAQVPAILRESAEKQGAKVARAGISAFTQTTIDYELTFEFPGNDGETANAGRDAITAIVLHNLAEAKVDLSSTARPSSSLHVTMEQPASTAAVTN